MKDVPYLGEVTWCADTLFHCQSLYLMLVLLKIQTHDCEGFASTLGLPMIFRHCETTITCGNLIFICNQLITLPQLI